jgi:hypothetical protein
MLSLSCLRPCCCAVALTLPGLAVALDRSTLPDEITATGGQGNAQSGSGAALISDQAAIHINPAMLYRHKTYDVNGTYIWPVEGRPFYKVAAIDGMTSSWATAFEYTGFTEGLENRASRDQDSPARRRASLAFAIPTDKLALGFAGHYVEADDPTRVEEKTVKGFTLGAGLALPLSETLRFGASIENFNNKKVRNLSPRIFRAGLGWENKASSLGFHLDYRDRERSEYLEDRPLDESGALAARDPGIEPIKGDNEKMVIFGAQLQTLDIVRVFASAGRQVSGKKSEISSGGIGLYQKNFSLAYSISRLYPNSDLQNSLSLSITMKL